VSATFALSANSHTVSTGGSVVVTLATTNIPAGTPVQYIITANLKEPLPVIYTTTKFSGVCSVSSLINGTTLDTHSHTGNRLLTTSSSSGMVTTIPNAILGAAALSQSTYASPGGLQYTGDDWDGYWEVPLPFNITYLDTTYSKFYVSTNLYVTFELGSVFSNPSESVPALRKIVISSSGFSTDQTLYHGVEGSAPNRTYRIRHTGTTYVPELLNRQPVEYEIVFYENNPAQIDIQIGENGSWVPTTSGSVYPFSYADVDVPLVGDMIINNNTATLPITVSSTDELIMSVRLGIFPTPSVNITVN
jgi:hypothetical protein